MFYDIIESNDVQFKVGENGALENLELSNTHYTIVLDNTKVGLIISVTVTKQYDNWLYSIDRV